jgi:Leucine rich repeat
MLSPLEILFLSSNKFQGPVPSLSDGSVMRGLYLSDNKLNGTIPTSLCALKNLEALLLDTNQLQGTIPECIGNLVKLRQLFLFKNQLTGQVPAQLSQLSKLGKLRTYGKFVSLRPTIFLIFCPDCTDELGIEQNDLTGQVSNDVCKAFSSASVDFWADCGGSTPEMSCKCCTICCPAASCSA